MSVNGKKTDIGMTDLLAAGKVAGLDERNCRSIVAEVREAVRDWPKFAAEADVRGEFVEKIGNVLTRENDL